MKLFDDSPTRHAPCAGRRPPPRPACLLTLVTHWRRRQFGHYDVAHAVARELGGRHLWRNHVLHAWLLMPDQAHLLCELAGDESLPQLVSRIKFVTAALGNGVLQQKGAFWARGHHVRVLRPREDLQQAACRLVDEPVRAGLVESAWEWPFWNSRWVRCLGDLPAPGDAQATREPHGVAATAC